MFSFLVFYSLGLLLCPKCALGLDGSNLAGVEFGDNGVQKYVVQDNGVAVAHTKISMQVSFCAWLYPKWSRWRKYLLIMKLKGFHFIYIFRKNFHGSV